MRGVAVAAENVTAAGCTGRVVRNIRAHNTAHTTGDEGHRHCGGGEAGLEPGDAGLGAGVAGGAELLVERVEAFGELGDGGVDLGGAGVEELEAAVGLGAGGALVGGAGVGRDQGEDALVGGDRVVGGVGLVVAAGQGEVIAPVLAVARRPLEESDRRADLR